MGARMGMWMSVGEQVDRCVDEVMSGVGGRE